MSKGSSPRPFDVDHDKFSNNWDKIFGKKEFIEEKKNDSKEPKDPENKKNK